MGQTMVSCACQQCGKNFKRRSAEVKRQTSESCFCSIKCAAITRGKKRTAKTNERARQVKEFGMKTCGSCKKYLSADRFPRKVNSNDGLAYDCRECNKQKALNWYMGNKERAHQTHVCYVHGLTRGQFDAMLEAQGGGCAICGRKEKAGRKIKLSVDHIHDKTGRIRGLLCSNCNFGIGHFQDNPARLRLAAAYLEQHQAGK